MDIIEFFKIILSWPPVVLIIIIYLVRKISKTPGAIEKFFQNIKTIKVSEFELQLKDQVEKQKDQINEQQKRINEQQEEFQKQQEIINNEQKKINAIIRYSMADYIYNHLKAIYEGHKNNIPYIFHKTDEMIRDLKFLRNHGFLEFFEVRQQPNGQDLVKVTRPTPIGIYCVELREGIKNS